jgi:hypothetical protein
MNAEQIIKKHLDGKFFRTDAMGKTTVKEVPLDYIPDHKPIMLYDCVPTDPNYIHHNTRPWLPQDDDMIVELRGAGARWDAIARRLKRELSSVRMRYQAVCAERGIEMVKSAPGKPSYLTPEIKADIVRLRDQGMSFVEITRVLNLNEYAARDYYHRHKSKMKTMRRAA